MTAPDGSFLSCDVALPDDFRVAPILAFHGRDPRMLAERVQTGAFCKGMAWRGRPACLTIRFTANSALASLAVDGAAEDGEGDALERLVRRMLGLAQPIGEFESRFAAHPQLGSLIGRHRGLRVPVTATPFEALAWAVTGQQISVGVAVSLRRRLIEAVGLRHSCGLYCHPDAGQLCRLTEADLRNAGFSQAKARTLTAIAHQVRDGHLPLDAWAATIPVEDIRRQLSQVRGIGPWTIDYTLLRGFGWLDGSLHGDAAVRRNLALLLQVPDKVGENRARDWLAEFSPWRALVAAHLWAMSAADIY